MLTVGPVRSGPVGRSVGIPSVLKVIGDLRSQSHLTKLPAPKFSQTSKTPFEGVLATAGRTVKFEESSVPGLDSGFCVWGPPVVADGHPKLSGTGPG